jgi:hypothetical protein
MSHAESRTHDHCVGVKQIKPRKTKPLRNQPTSTLPITVHKRPMTTSHMISINMNIFREKIQLNLLLLIWNLDI